MQRFLACCQAQRHRQSDDMLKAEGSYTEEDQLTPHACRQLLFGLKAVIALSCFL